MTKAGSDVPYRIWRCDVWEHRKTAGMWPLSYSVKQYAVSQNILGVLEKSPRMIASKFRDTTESDVIEAIGELCQRKIARWWPELETLWIVEALDEQSFGGKADIGAAKIANTFPQPVLDAISKRYGDRLGLYFVGDTTLGQGASSQDQKQDQKQEQEHQQSLAGMAHENESVDQVLAHMRALRKELTGREAFRSVHPSQTLNIRILLRTGVPVSELLEVLDARLWDAKRNVRRKSFLGFDAFRPERWEWSQSLVEEMQAAPQSEAVDIAELARRQREERGE